MSRIKVGIAMSGGVDSTVAASLLQEQGYQVHGFFMLLPLAHLDVQLQRVAEVADSLAVPLTRVDVRPQFSDQVIRYFIDGYRAGQTPNPCMQCNRLVKFGTLAATMMHAGMDKIATGHYARVGRRGGHSALLRGADRRKDQSYFLARLAPAQLQHLLFPLGEWTKGEVYQRAQRLGLPFQGEESQDVCFLSQGLPAFLAAQGIRDTIGPIVTRDGVQLGEHRGVWHYTIGQRRGLGLPDATPWYVVGIEAANNRIIVGKDTDLLQEVCAIHLLQWSHEPPALPWRGQVQLRLHHPPAAVQVCPAGPDCWLLVFDTPQRAITPGQFAVFYEGDQVLGSGVISGPGAAAEAVTG